MKTNLVKTEKPSDRTTLDQDSIPEANSQEGQDFSEHFESILQVYQRENEDLRKQLHDFQISNQNLRQENIDLRIKLSALESSRELEITRVSPSLVAQRSNSEMRDAFEDLPEAKPMRKSSQRIVPDSEFKSPSIILCPSQKEVSPCKRPARKSKKNRTSTSKYVPSYTRNLKNN